MHIRYIYSACVVIATDDLRLLCDPWMTEGIYDGSWFHYPPLDDPIQAIGEVDAIYISHIHPDHYDAAFLRRYLAVYPKTRLLIGPQTPPYLAMKMKLDGFTPETHHQLSVGGTDLLIVPNQGGGGAGSEVDSALVVREKGRTVVNMNDNPFMPRQIEAILDFCPQRKVDVALLPYAGAGPFPQTFHFTHREELEAAAARKRAQFLDLFRAYVQALAPKMALPFAGKYVLGGQLSELNPFRGVPDAVELLTESATRVLVLADGGQATYDIDTGVASACRIAPYDPAEVARYLAALGGHPYDYETEIVPQDGRPLPILPLLTAATARARGKVKVEAPYWIVFHARGQQERCFVLNIADSNPPLMEPPTFKPDQLEPRLEITIDERYLFGLLTRLYHWNNAEIGSHYRSLRVPQAYLPVIYGFLNMLQI